MTTKRIEVRVARLEEAAKQRGLNVESAEDAEANQLMQRWLGTLSEDELGAYGTSLQKRDYALNPGDWKWCRMPGCGCANRRPEGAFNEKDDQVIAAFRARFETWATSQG